MIRKVLLGLCIAFSLCFASQAPVLGQVRVKCDRFTMNVPSDNVRCFRTDGNIPVSEDAATEDIESAQIANTAIAFIDYERVASRIPPQVVFYTLEDLTKTSFDLLDIATSLSDMMNNISAGYTTVQDVYQSVPFLPYQAQQRTVYALPAELDFEGGSGIRTIAVFGDTVEAVASGSNLYYSFQGISSDGSLYVSAVFPIRSTMLNAQSVSGISWDKADDDFVPSIDELDFYIKSIVIE